jgi:predicted polyphosphate/ATP-dependent NAD kinase
MSASNEPPLRIGLVINPEAGLGGRLGFKGSDGAEVKAMAKAVGATSQAQIRVEQALAPLKSLQGQVDWFAAGGQMGEDILLRLGIISKVITTRRDVTEASDTKLAVVKLQAQGIDLLLFAGGDGTARDVLDAITPSQVALGIPCGVKMHSGVFAQHPVATAQIIQDLVAKRLVSGIAGEVRDIDEAAFRDNRVEAKFYGEMLIPDALRYIQATKVGGRESDELVVEEIAAGYIEAMDAEVVYFMGGGRTVGSVMRALGLPNTLLGIDVVRGGKLLQSDANEQDLLNWAQESVCRIVVSVIGGQGHIFGRGNQQLSAAVLMAVGTDQVDIVATKRKLAGLRNGLLIADTGDAQIDSALAGLRAVTTGYQDSVLIRVGTV